MIRTGAINWQNPIAQVGLNDGLVAWYLARGPMIGGARWRDLCGRHLGVLTNMELEDWTPSRRPGGSYHLDIGGTNERVLTATAPSVTGRSTTIAAWVMLDALTSAMRIITIADGANSVQLNLDTASHFMLNHSGIVGGGNSFNFTASTGTWYHLIGTFDDVNNVYAFYLNGVELSVLVAGLAFSSPTALGISLGSRTDGTGVFLDGKLDDVRIYDRAISAGDASQLYSDSLAGCPLTLRRLGRRVGYVAATGWSGPVVGSRIVDSRIVRAA